MGRLLLIVFLLTPLAGYAAEDIRRVEGLEVDKVVVFGAVEVEISQGEPTLLLVRGSESRLDAEPFYTQGATLVLGMTADGKGTKRELDGVKFKLTLPALTSLSLKGSGDVYLKPMAVEDLDVALDGSGDIRMFALSGRRVTLQMSGSGDIQLVRLKAGTVEMTLSGSGDIDLGTLAAETAKASLSGSGDIAMAETGTSQVLSLNIVGSGDVDFSNLDAKRVTINIIGSGSAQVGRSEELEVTVMGSGDVYYRGQPEIRQSILGSGELHGTD